MLSNDVKKMIKLIEDKIKKDKRFKDNNEEYFKKIIKKNFKKSNNKLINSNDDFKNPTNDDFKNPTNNDLQNPINNDLQNPIDTLSLSNDNLDITELVDMLQNKNIKTKYINTDEENKLLDELENHHKKMIKTKEKIKILDGTITRLINILND